MDEFMSASLSKDTRITMENGSEKKIQEIRIGETVLLSTGKTIYISNMYWGMERDMIEIRTNNDALVINTRDFVLLEGGNWKVAADVTINDTVCTKNGLAKVISIQNIIYDDKVYNIATPLKEEYGIFANGFIVGKTNY